MAAIDIPTPGGVVTSVVTTATGWTWEKVADGLTRWVLDAVAYFVDGTVHLLLTSARPEVEAVWFTGDESPYATIRNVAGVSLGVFVFLGLLQGLLIGDTSGMVRRVSVDLPLAVLGMVVTTAVVANLLELTDALSAAVLESSGGQAVHFLSGFGVSVNSATQGFAALLLGLVAVFAGFLVWVELLVRSVLVYLLVAVSPLAFAATVWPAARGILRRVIEMLLAVILSKLVIAIALSVGVAALSGAGTAAEAGQPDLDQASVSLGTLLVGTSILAMAAFAPFLVLKLVPVAEAAVVAYGVSRSPVRAAQSTMGTVTYMSSVGRLSGSGRAGTSSSNAAGAADAAGGSGASLGATAVRLASGAPAAGAIAGAKAGAGKATRTAADAAGSAIPPSAGGQRATNAEGRKDQS